MVIVNGCGVQILSGNNLKVFSVAFNYMSFRHIHHIHMVRINILVSSFIYIYISVMCLDTSSIFVSYTSFPRS